jgi:hypothetical protein
MAGSRRWRVAFIENSTLQLIELKLPPALFGGDGKCYLDRIKSGPLSLADAGSSTAGHQQRTDMRLVPGGTFRMGSDRRYPEQV